MKYCYSKEAKETGDMFLQSVELPKLPADVDFRVSNVLVIGVTKVQ